MGESGMTTAVQWCVNQISIIIDILQKKGEEAKEREKERMYVSK